MHHNHTYHLEASRFSKLPNITLACKTADLLTLTTHSLNRVTSFGPYHLLSVDDRKSALHQLSMTVQAAARLAELAQPEVLGGHTEHVRVRWKPNGRGREGGCWARMEIARWERVRTWN
ncbi:hypothetical protein P167DRAFT_82840 [Morchella conica CCBAS932]|uniref:Uncharacterized protein n=1 Tax=Morchella conica CCBAS932 TaxID=1392247 RepID=A0A3N4KDZ5_9PEZI|nr:hypothetical protein P167DRAFT_82840 [Morchella conica CCBAS932]